MSERNYWIASGEQTRGPFTRTQIKSLWRDGLLSSDNLVRREGTEFWRPVKEAVERWDHRPHRSATILKWVLLLHLVVFAVAIVAVARHYKDVKPPAPRMEVVVKKEVENWVEHNVADPDARVMEWGPLEPDPQYAGHYSISVDVLGRNQPGGDARAHYRFRMDGSGKVIDVKMK